MEPRMPDSEKDPGLSATQGKHLGIFICWLLGSGCLFGFYSMLTMEDYFAYIFPDYHPTRVITLVYLPFVLGTTAIFMYHEAKINTRARNLVGYTLFFLCLLALIILDVSTSGRGGAATFAGVCTIAAVFGIAEGHAEGAMAGDLSLMCPEFIQSFWAGQAASGVITSALRLVTKKTFENSRNGLRNGAMMFASIACIFELLCIVVYVFVFPKLPIVKFYHSKAASEGSMTVNADLAAGGIESNSNTLAEEGPVSPDRLSSKQILLQNLDYTLDMSLIYTLSLSIFPGFLAEDTGSHSLGSWYALVLIASYSVWDLIGRYLPLINCIKLTSRKGLLVATCLRFLFVPGFYYTVKYGDQGWVIMLTAFLGLSNGYLTVCVLTEAPKGYKGPEQNALGNLLVLSLLMAGTSSYSSIPHEPELSTEDDDEEVGKAQGKYLGIFICWLLGNGCLFGFNGMVTIEDYYVFLFPNYHPTRIITLTYQPFVLATTAIFTYHEAEVNTRVRNLAGYILFLMSSFGVIILDILSSGSGGIVPFIGVCIIAAAFGIADGHVQGGMTGDLSLMCPEFIQSLFAGLAASGAITSTLRFFTKAVFENSRDGIRKGAMLFSSISCFFELLCVLLYAFVFPKLPIVKFYRSKAASEGSLTVTADLAAGGIKSDPDPWVEEGPAHAERLSNKQLLQQNMDYAIDMFLIYVLTLSIFPGFLAEDTGSHSLGSWYALVLIASFNVFDLIGRYLPLIQHIKITSRKGLLIAVISRFLLIPAFYYTAKYGDQGWMIMLTSFLGLSNGHLTVCVLTEAPNGYKGPEQNALGNLLVLLLLAGIFCGAVSDWLWLIGKGW
ncbi:hypothetical protein QOZ80_7BG0603780 [Eleusine coracana subsp. coracana]|nr:hypothetical protein QOZ80_7BG0603780 [Eleusine coracana subsp. coracana]